MDLDAAAHIHGYSWLMLLLLLVMLLLDAVADVTRVAALRTDRVYWVHMDPYGN